MGNRPEARNDKRGAELVKMIQEIGIHPEKFINIEHENILWNGERVWVSWTNKAIYDENNHVVGILSIGNDITGRKQAEDELKQAKEKASSASKIAGFTLGRVVSFSENISGEPRMYYETAMGKGGASSSVAPSPQIEPGSQEIKINVTLTYLIK